ncbi:MAG TPA: zinc ABC transporter substrate-binding protein, partial [Anaerolineae bacterium]|nr:zinc ABC transporter substrate-binding protein [Anaerolineae bacterium]HIQ04814.1 zinc ABC transporter substrate-binding protein [Anaerolineae bacterium]
MSRFISLLLMLSVLLGACGPKTPASAGEKLPAETGGPISVVVSILPLEDLVRQVGGKRTDIVVLVPPGTSPHTFEPTPSQVRAVAQADMLVLVGLGLEFWAQDLIESSGNQDLVVVYTSDGIDVIQAVSVEGEKPVGNPHVWLDPLNAIIMVNHIRDGLIRVDPNHRAEYEANAKRFTTRLKELDQEVRQTVAGFSHREFVAFHPAWVYFAREYGLEQAAVVERTPGREPSPAEIAEIVTTAKAIGARAIFAEPQFSPKAAQIIAEESGAQVLFLDPLGSSLEDHSYINLIRYNLKQMVEAL